MANNRTIALRISGTKQRQAGFAPLVSAGVLAGNEGENMDRVLLVPEARAFLIKHAADYILYLLIDRRVKSFDADAPGVLSIALTIGSAVQLADGKSPYTLLMEVYDTFRTMYMTPMSDGRNGFQNKDADSNLFRDILGRYPLEDRRTRYIPMADTKESCVMNVPREKMEAFFRDTQYKEFAGYGSIEIGSTAHIEDPQNAGLDSIVIPRPIAYQVSVNGERVGGTLVRPEDECFASLPDRDLDAWEPVRFTLGEVLAAPAGVLEKDGAVIKLDPVSETLSCVLKKKEIRYNLSATVVAIDNDRMEVASLLRGGKIRILLDGRDITEQALNKAEVDPMSVIGKPLTLQLFSEKYDVTVMPVRDDAARKVVLKLTATRRRGGAPVMPVSDPGTDRPEDERKGGLHGKSLLIGFLLGLIVGVGIMLLLQLFTGDKEAKDETVPSTEQPVSSPDPSQMSNIQTPEELEAQKQQALRDSLAREAERLLSEQREKERQDSIAKAEADAKAKADAEAKAAADKAAADAKAKQDQARAELVSMINGGADYQKCKASKEWQELAKKDQYVIDRVLNYEQYKKDYKAGTVAMVKAFVEKSIEDKPLKSWGDLVKLDEEVQNKVKESKKN